MLPVQESDFYLILGQRIKTARQKAGINQEAFAGYLRLSRASIVNIERGRQRPPIHTLWNISKLLSTDLVTLFPDFDSSVMLNPNYQSKLSQQDKGARKKIIAFIEEVQSPKNNETQQ
ncbi:MAG: helix-turn-helix transcriptional regulator [Chitinophagales bacterium]